MKRSVLVLMLAITACGDPGPAPATTTPTGGPPTTAASTTEAGVAVTITATPVQQADGSIELCPAGINGPCPGIVLDGDLDPDLISAPDQSTVIQVSGTYDGRRLTPTSEPTQIEHPSTDPLDFSSLCDDLEGNPGGPSENLTQGLAEYAAGQPDYAGMWWDQASWVMTVWFVGDDVTDHQDAIIALSPDEPVCVAGGARFSEAELLEAMDLLPTLYDTRGRPLTAASYGADTIRNHIPLSVEEIDPETRRLIEDAVGARVALLPFIEMLDAPLGELPEPVPVVEGDVDLMTSEIRAAAGMDALGTFEVRYDADVNCVYLTGAAGDTGYRLAPVWPFGYSATSAPLTVYDYDGNVVVTESETIELGGGAVDAAFVDGDVCGADEAWVVNR